MTAMTTTATTVSSDSGAGADRECRAGVTGLDQVDRAAEQPDLPLRAELTDDQ